MGFDPVAFARTGNGAIAEQEKLEEFDPVAFAMGGRDVLAPKARAAYGADEMNTPVVRDLRAPNRADAFIGEMAQGVSLGFADELQGMANGTGMRNVMREQSAANRDAYPGTALAGGLAGGLITAPLTTGAAGAGMIGKALASPVARAAVEGAVAGAGYSDADTAAGRLTGAALGAAGGAVVAKALPLVGQGIKKLIAGAPERVEQKMIRDLVGSTNPSARNKLLGPGGVKSKDVAEVIRSEPGIRKALGDEQATYAAVKSASDRLDEEMTGVYRLVDESGDRIHTGDVWKRTKEHTDKLRQKFMPEIADKLDSAIENRLGSKVGADGTADISLTAGDMRSLVSSIQRQAFEGGTVNPSVAKETTRNFSMVLREMLNEHVEGAAVKHGIDVSPIRALNKKRSILANLEDVTERNAIREVGATKVAPFSLDNAERLMKSPGAALGSVLTGNALPYYGTRAAVAGVKGLDVGLAKLVEWARRSGGFSRIPRSELLERAAKFGVSKQAAARLAEIKPAAAR